MEKIVELKIKCPCGFKGWIEQEGNEDNGGTNLCPVCSSDTWDEISHRIREVNNAQNIR